MGDNEQLGEAFNRLTIVQLAQELGLELRRGGGQKSPFRDDKKAGSFSVQDDYFKDHAWPDHKGGHIAFVMLARPGMSKREAIEFIIRAAGLEPTPYSPGAARRVDKEKREKLFSNRERDWATIPKVEESSLWSAAVEARFVEGLEFEGSDAQFEKLAESRGWMLSTLLWLLMNNKMAAPALPWGNKRGCAFVVEKPVFKAGGVELGLVPVGYHQRWIKRDEHGLQKNWCFVPYKPTEPKTDFQKELKKADQSVPAYPFVMGDLGSARLVVMLEGQWDAISFAAAFDWLKVGFPVGVCVMGLRGVQGFNPLLAGYGAWLQKHKPLVWFVGDNDAAGKSVLERKDADKINGEPSFVDRLRALGCRVYPMFLEVEGCKDFNDIYKAHRPDVADMQKLAAVAGAGDLV